MQAETEAKTMEKTIKPSELKELLAENKNTMIIDVRRKADYDIR